MIEKAIKTLLSQATGERALPYQDKSKKPQVYWLEVSTGRSVVIDATPDGYRQKRIQVEIRASTYQAAKKLCESVEDLHGYQGSMDNTFISLISVVDVPFKHEPEGKYYRSTIDIMVHYDT